MCHSNEPVETELFSISVEQIVEKRASIPSLFKTVESAKDRWEVLKNGKRKRWDANLNWKHVLQTFLKL